VEQNSGMAAVRKRGEGDLGSKSLQEIVEQIHGEILAKK
jgi:threonyl-tRNA synthetase